MLKKLKDILNLKGEDINDEIIMDSDVVRHFEIVGMVGCEYIPDMGLGQDSDFEELLDYLEADINVDVIIKDEKKYVLFYDNETYILVNTEEYENRFGDDIGGEQFYDFNDIIVLDKESITKCDICNKIAYQESLINIDPQNFKENNLKEEYEGFDGMVCKRCHSNMLK